MREHHETQCLSSNAHHKDRHAHEVPDHVGVTNVRIPVIEGNDPKELSRGTTRLTRLCFYYLPFRRTKVAAYCTWRGKARNVRTMPQWRPPRSLALTRQTRPNASPLGAAFGALASRLAGGRSVAHPVGAVAGSPHCHLFRIARGSVTCPLPTSVCPAQSDLLPCRAIPERRCNKALSSFCYVVKTEQNM